MNFGWRWLYCRCRIGLLCGLLFVTSLGVAASVEPHGAAVAGSFTDTVNAYTVFSEVNKLIRDIPDVEAHIVPVEVKGRAWHRVVVAGQMHGRELVERLRNRGIEAAWYWSDYAPVVRSRRQVASRETDDAVPRRPSPKSPTSIVLSDAETAGTVQQVVVSNELNPGTIELIDVLDGIPRHRIEIQTRDEADNGVVLDGKVDEAIWQTLPFYDEFMVAVPDKGTPGEFGTEMRLFATEKGLYVSAIMYQPPDTLVRRLSARDKFMDRDTFGFTVDGSGEALVGYWLITALGGSVQDGKLLPERNYQSDWDGPWIGKSAVRDDGWSAEIFLPWSMMNMPVQEGKRTLGFVATRQVSHKNERYQWPGHPYSSAKFLSAFNEIKVAGVEPVSQLSVIPFAAATLDEANDDDELRIGADIAWKPSPKFEVSATINPDFGAVEADDVVLNLTAFETFFPEKRLFFLAGNEVFDAMPRASSGNIFRFTTNEDFASTSRRVFLRDFIPSPVSLLNTRRIGGTARQVTLPSGVTENRGQRDLPTDLLGAAKFTGSLGDTRYGLMGAFEDDVEWRGTDALGNPYDIEDEGREFGVARFIYEDVGATRRSIGYLGTRVSGPLFDATVHSLDAHYTSASGKVVADAQLIQSDRADVEGYGGLFDLVYAVKGGLRHKFELDYMDENVNFNDIGFMRRNNYANARYILLFNKQTLTDSISNFRTTLIAEQQYNIDPGLVTNSALFWRTSMVLPGRNTFKTSVGLLPKRWEDVDSRGNGAYRVDDRAWVDFLVSTSALSKLSFSGSVGALQEHLGDWTYNGYFGLTYRPWDNLVFDFELRYKKRQGWLVYQGQRNFGSYNGTEWQPSLNLSWFLSSSHQFKLSLQWVGVRADEDEFFTIPAGDGDLVPGTRTLADHDFTVSLMTAQLRYRWEIAPLTDFFLVYNRGNSLANQIDSPFDDLFDDVLREPIIDSVVAKLRWRFGN